MNCLLNRESVVNVKDGCRVVDKYCLTICRPLQMFESTVLVVNLLESLVVNYGRRLNVVHLK